MSQFVKVTTKLPVEGEIVEVQLTSGQIVKGVEFAGGRFWKFRSGNGGHPYDVEAWRSIKVEEGKGGATESQNG